MNDKNQVPDEPEDDLLWIQENLRVPKSQHNDFGNFDYRTLEDILEEVKPLCAERNCRLFLVDEIVMVGKKLPVTVGTFAKGQEQADVMLSGPRVYVRTTAHFTDSKGVTIKVPGYAREPMDKKGMDEMQITGASASYAGKRALGNLFLLDDNRDADSMVATTEEQIDQFRDWVENAQSDKLWHMKVTQPALYAALFDQSPPKGERTKFKKLARDVSYKGYQAAEEDAKVLITAANKKDAHGIREITEQATIEHKHLVWLQLPDDIKKRIQDILKEEA